MKNRTKRAGFAVVCILALAIMSAGCPKQPVETPITVKPAITTASDLFALVQARAASVDRLDASLEARLTGAAVPYRGRFYGTMQMERQGDELGLWLQAYTVVGLPVLEVVSIGNRVLVYSPLDSSAYYNFESLSPPGQPRELPLNSFERVALPLGLITDQLALLWGMGISPELRYDLSETDEAYLITEWDGDAMLRQMEYARPGLELLRVKVYRGAILEGSMSCDKYPESGDARFMPGRIEMSREGIELGLKLSQVRTNSEVTGKAIEFAVPKADRFVLLTPPVP